MSNQRLTVRGSGLVTSVGLSAPAACAAIRSKLTNPSETRFIDRAGERIMSHAVPLDRPLRGLAKLARMATMVVEECLEDLPRDTWERIPILLCVAERSRPGRLEGLEDRLMIEVCALLAGARLSVDSRVIAQGRVSVALALLQARQVLYGSPAPAVLIVAVDSLLTWPTLKVFEEQERLLTNRNSNG